MSFGFTEDQQGVFDNVARLCARFDADYWRRTDETGDFPEAFVAAMAEGGWLGVAIPEEYGGGGRGITEAAIVLREVARSGAAMNGCSALHLTIFGPTRWCGSAASGSSRPTCRGPPPATCTWRSA
jgi:acyl-CoA dehydrogenase